MVFRATLKLSPHCNAYQVAPLSVSTRRLGFEFPDGREGTRNFFWIVALVTSTRRDILLSLCMLLCFVVLKLWWRPEE